jgi:hypothetical protein
MISPAFCDEVVRDVFAGFSAVAFDFVAAAGGNSTRGLFSISSSLDESLSSGAGGATTLFGAIFFFLLGPGVDLASGSAPISSSDELDEVSTAFLFVADLAISDVSPATE